MNAIKYFKDYIEGINEGLIKTNSLTTVSEQIHQNLSLLGFDVFLEKKTNKFSLKINHFNKIDPPKVNLLFEHVLSMVVNVCGWFPSFTTITNIYGKNISRKYDLEEILSNYEMIDSLTILFEAKFDEIEENIPEKLYHLSIQEYNDKIKKFGLIPKSKSKISSHLDRIYLCKNIESCKKLITQMSICYHDEKSKNIFLKNKPIIYEIDNSSKIIHKLYKDPNFIEGYYTVDNIDKNFITEVWRKN